MKNYSAAEIERLQNNLLAIRKAGGWSAEEFGDMIGVTKQTISNLENKKTVMSKTQYIAIRAVLDYEMAEHPNNKALVSTVNLCLNSEGLSENDAKTAQAFVEGATKTGLDDSAIMTGLGVLVGLAATELILSTPEISESVASWISKVIKGKK